MLQSIVINVDIATTPIFETLPYDVPLNHPSGMLATIGCVVEAFKGGLAKLTLRTLGLKKVTQSLHMRDWLEPCKL